MIATAVRRTTLLLVLFVVPPLAGGCRRNVKDASDVRSGWAHVSRESTAERTRWVLQTMEDLQGEETAESDRAATVLMDILRREYAQSHDAWILESIERSPWQHGNVYHLCHFYSGMFDDPVLVARNRVRPTSFVFCKEQTR